MSEIKLLRCPFCGGEAKLMKFPKCERKYVVICENVQCMASVGNYSYSKEKAIKAWNTRKPIENIVERLEELYDDIPVQYETNYESGIEKGYCDAIEIVKEEGKYGKELRCRSIRSRL